MPSKEEKKRRQALLRAIQEKRQAEAEARMPISKQDLKALLLSIDEKVFEERNGEVECLCDHSLRHTRESCVAVPCLKSPLSNGWGHMAATVIAK